MPLESFTSTLEFIAAIRFMLYASVLLAECLARLCSPNSKMSSEDIQRY